MSSVIAEIVMDGPAKNALGTQMMTYLLDELRQAGGKPVILSGAGDAFSAGLNLREVAALDAVGMELFLRLLERCMAALYLYPGPTVALVNGHAIAGGCILTLACDYRVAASNPKIKIGLNEVALGLRFPPRVLAIVRGRVPSRHRTEVLLGAQLFAPEQALALGLVDQVTEDAPNQARARLEALAAHPSEAYAATKRDLRGASETELGSDEQLDRWMKESLAVWTANTLKDKIAAMLGR